MTKEFKELRYEDPEDQIIRLSRKQIEQMAEMIGHFKDVDEFQLRINSKNGIGQSVRFTFDLDLTDVSKW